MAELAEVFRTFGPQYLERFAAQILPSHRRALADIAACRTEVFGGHLSQCERCGYQHYAYHSCRNRSCPKCHTTDTERWLHSRQAELLPVAYFHVIFTLPEALREAVRRHQKALYGALIKAAAQSLMTLAADPHYVGGQIGLLSVLHTWGKAMAYHPHVHCLVPAGGLSKDGRWLAARHKYLVPVEALSVIFRAKFMEYARKVLPQEHFAQSLWQGKWVVYCKPAIQGSQKVLRYLARYVHRVAITNSRIKAIHNGGITFETKNSRTRRWAPVTLSAEEFIRRFLQHVLPKRFNKVRYYGLLSPANRSALRQLQLLLADRAKPVENQNDEKEESPDADEDKNCHCPKCETGLLVIVLRLPRQSRAPP